MYVRRSKHLEISRNSLIVAKMYAIMTKEIFIKNNFLLIPRISIFKKISARF